MKRLNRKKIIEEFEFLRQGFKDAYDFLANQPADKMSMDALHKNADRMVIELGGESVRADSNKQIQSDTYRRLCPNCGANISSNRCVYCKHICAAD